MQNDAELVLTALQGDLEACAHLVMRYSNALFSIAYSFTGDFHLSQDIAQDSFIKAFDRKIPTSLQAGYMPLPAGYRWIIGGKLEKMAYLFMMPAFQLQARQIT